MKKYISIIGLLLAISLLLPMVALASYDYYITITVFNNNAGPLSSVPVVVNINNSQLASLGYILPSGLDTSVVEGSTSRDFMVANISLGFIIPSIESYQSRTYRYRLGESSLQSEFPFIGGSGCSVNYTDADDIELSTNFSIEYNGGIDTSYTFDYPNVKGNATSRVLTPTTSHTVSLPSSYAKGDLLIVFFMSFTPDGGTITWPSDWTQMFQTPGTIHRSAAYKIASGSEGTTITVTSSASGSSSHCSYAIEDYGAVPVYGEAATGASTSPDSGSLTVPWGAYAGTLWLTAQFNNGAYCTGYPTGWSGGQFTNTTTSGVGVAWNQTQATSVNPSAFTISPSKSWYAYTFGIRGPSTTIQMEKPNSYKLWVPSEGQLQASFNTSYSMYRYGTYQDDYVVGYTTGSGYQYKGPNYLYLEANSTTLPAERTYVISSYTLNISNFDTINVDWENTGIGSGGFTSGYVCVSTCTTGNYSVFDAIIAHTDNWTRCIESVSVASLNKNETIRIHAHVSAGAGTGQSARLKVYRIWYSISIPVTLIAACSSDEHTVKVWGNGTAAGMILDGTPVATNTLFLGRMGVYDSTDDWNLYTPWFSYYKETVGNNLSVWYEPISMVGDTLTDRSGCGHTGTITWGIATSGLEVTIGGMEPFSSYVAPGAEEEVVPEVPMPGSISTDQTAGATGVGLPLYINFKNAADSLQWTVPTTYTVAFEIVAIVVGVGAMAAAGSVWGWVGGFGATSALFGQVKDGGGHTIVPWWITILCVAFAIFTGYVWKYT